MKTTMLYSLLFLTLLGVGIGCKKEVEDVKPPVVVSPPTSGTTLPVSTTPVATTPTAPTMTTPVSFSFSEGPAPANLTNCRVLQHVTKVTYAAKPYIDTEVIVIGGQSYTVSSSTKTAFEYDSQGRLLKETEVYYLWKTSVTTYIYQAGFVLRQKDTNPTDTLWLNAQGFVDRETNYKNYTYSTDGLLTGYDYLKPPIYERFITENGNQTQIIGYYGTSLGTWTYTYSHNLAQKNTVMNAGLYGKPDRNVQTGRVIVTKNVSPEYAPNGEIRKDDIYTEFDKYGRIKRTIQVKTFEAKDVNTPLGPNVKVTDFQYECL
jgi:hypothetical protein